VLEDAYYTDTWTKAHKHTNRRRFLLMFLNNLININTFECMCVYMYIVLVYLGLERIYR
jgi:hypothetical protein